MRLVVDTDTGIDDALALIWLAAQPDVEIVEVTTTHGNCSTEQSTANVGAVLDLVGLDHVPVTGGLSVPLAGELSLAWFVHGRDGLGDCGVAPPPASPAPAGAGAVEALRRLAAAGGDDLHLLALGPLTNLGAAERDEPGTMGAFASVTIMGGTGPRLGPGDPDPTGGVGDPNTYHDVEAARLVAAAPTADDAVALAGVDVTMGCTAGADHLARLDAATTTHGRFAAAICGFYVDFYERAHGRRALTLHDPLAAMCAVGHEVGATWHHGELVVDGDGEDARAVVAGPAAPGTRRTRALSSADATAAADSMLHALEHPLPRR